MSENLIPKVPGHRILPDNPGPPPTAGMPSLITIDQLRAICPDAPKGADAFIPYLQTLFHADGILTVKQRAMFVAQVWHESGGFRYTREIWGPTTAQQGYEGRADLGNTQPGDGKRFMGRGLIQITGRANYAACGRALNVDLLAMPQLLETPSYAVASAGWYWRLKGFNEIMAEPDIWRETVTISGKKRSLGQLGYVTYRVNGGFNGLDARRVLYERALKVLV